MILGPRSIEHVVSLLARMKTLVSEHSSWNPLGGGDPVAALNAAGVTDRLTYVSTAGGAMHMDRGDRLQLRCDDSLGHERRFSDVRSAKSTQIDRAVLIDPWRAACSHLNT